MSQVFLYQPFRNAEGSGELIARHWGAGQEFDDASACGLSGIQHGDMVGIQTGKIQSPWTERLANPLKSEALNGCTAAGILSKSDPALIVTSRLTRWAGPVIRILQQSHSGPAHYRRGGLGS